MGIDLDNLLPSTWQNSQPVRVMQALGGSVRYRWIVLRAEQVLVTICRQHPGMHVRKLWSLVVFDEQLPIPELSWSSRCPI